MSEMVTQQFGQSLNAGDLEGFLRNLNNAADAVDGGVTACEAGCAYCCHLRVTATAPEILILADRIRTVPSAAGLSQKISATKAITKGMNDGERSILRQACPLLGAAGRCLQYDVRPLTCRLHYSLDAAVCERLAANEAADPSPLETAQTVHATLLRAQLNALDDAGYRATTFELNDGLDCALSIDKATEKWIAGVDVFANVQQGSCTETLAILRGV